MTTLKGQNRWEQVGKRRTCWTLTRVHHLWLLTVSSPLPSTTWIHRAKTEESTTFIIVTIAVSILATAELALSVKDRLKARSHFTQFTGYILKIEKYSFLVRLHRKRRTCPASSSILINRPAIDQFSRVTNEIAYPRYSSVSPAQSKIRILPDFPARPVRPTRWT